MMDTSLLAAGAVLMQPNTSGDLHLFTYFSKTFSAAEQNYDIYDQELLAVILALGEWKQYLQGTPHTVSVLTNYKKLSYPKDPRKLSCCQARWSLFLQDFNIIWKVTLGTQMGPADALSRKDHLDTTADNTNTPILPDPMVINALNLTLSCHIQSSSTSDPFVLTALAALNEGSLLFTQATLSDWSFDNGHLNFCKRLYVSPSAHSALLHSIHASPLSGHMGVFCTKSILEHDFWWPGLSTFVKHFIAGCAVCQQNKVNTHPTIPPLCPISSTISLPFKQLSVNLITNLPVTSGFDCVMVVVNHDLMKGVILAPCSKTVDAVGIAQLFFDYVFKRFGLHDTLISDQGPQFTSAFTKELTHLLKYDVHLSTAYHPQTDGQTKRTNQELETYLCIFCTNNPTKWVQFLPSAEFHHNSTPHSSTKMSPFSLLYGYEPCSYPTLGKTFLPALKEQLSKLDEARKEALAAHDST